MVATSLTRNQVVGLTRHVGSNPTVSAISRAGVIKKTSFFLRTIVRRTHAVAATEQASVRGWLARLPESELSAEQERIPPSPPYSKKLHF